MSTVRVVSLLAAVALLGACASEAPAETSFDSSAGLVVVEVLGDGFVRCEGRRVPLDTVVLELRQRTRRMTHDELGRFVVQLRAERSTGPEAAEGTQQSMDRLLGELQKMGVRQVRYL
ncbi:MAG TPA: hypothetical protein VF384_16760 [Planctomycetota bacterium]